MSNPPTPSAVECARSSVPEDSVQQSGSLAVLFSIGPLLRPYGHERCGEVGRGAERLGEMRRGCDAPPSEIQDPGTLRAVSEGPGTFREQRQTRGIDTNII